MIDTTQIGKVASEVMEKCAAAYEDTQNPEITAVCVIVEVEDENGWDQRVFSGEHRPHVVLAIIHEATIKLERQLDEAMDTDE